MAEPSKNIPSYKYSSNEVRIYTKYGSHNTAALNHSSEGFIQLRPGLAQDALLQWSKGDWNIHLEIHRCTKSRGLVWDPFYISMGQTCLLDYLVFVLLALLPMGFMNPWWWKKKIARTAKQKIMGGPRRWEDNWLHEATIVTMNVRPSVLTETSCRDPAGQPLAPSKPASGCKQC